MVPHGKAFNGTYGLYLRNKESNTQKWKFSWTKADTVGCDDPVAAYNHFAHKELPIHSAYTFITSGTLVLKQFF